MSNLPIIVVDDEPNALLSVETVLESNGYDNVVTCENAQKMWEELASHDADVILLDLMMPGIGGEETLKKLRFDYPDIPVIMATGVNELDTAVRCMRKGAHDYLLKPISRERLITSVRNALELRDLQRNNEALSASLLGKELHCPQAFADIRTTDPHMMAIFRYIEAVAPSSHPILVTGETGTGKELAARALHQTGKRTGEFVAVNAAGLDDTVLADTLFGHLKGAYTGADTSRAGLVEKAAGGTLFLDEIGDLSQASQVKLLRLLQEREYLPLGSDMSRQSNARIVAGTARPIEDLAGSDSFRKDLYYRLRTHHVHLPPLRERKGDIAVLVQHFLTQAASEYGKKVPTAAPELVPLLSTWHFPGNIRELRGMVFDALAEHNGRMLSLRTFKKALGMSENAVTETTPRETSRQSIEIGERFPSLREMETLLVTEAMKRAQGNRALAASLLGISRQAVSQRLKKMASEQ